MAGKSVVGRDCRVCQVHWDFGSRVHSIEPSGSVNRVQILGFIADQQGAKLGHFIAAARNESSVGNVFEAIDNT